MANFWIPQQVVEKPFWHMGNTALLGDQGRYQNSPQDVQKSVQRGRSKRGGQGYSVRYVEPPSAARTKLADFFNILLRNYGREVRSYQNKSVEKIGNLLEQAQAEAAPFNELSLSPTHPQIPWKVIFCARKRQTLKANRDKGLAVRKPENPLLTIDL